MEKDRSKRRYKPTKKLGAGSFATVFAAQDIKLNREVAVKQLHPQYLQDQSQLERYWQEAQLLASLEHPNIMTIFDVVRSKGCLVLEQMQGSLKEIYGTNPMPVEEVRETLIQAAKGLSCLHKNGMVHGDIKPGNLFLSRQDVVKLGDFGLARRVNDDDGSLVKGTTRYMAPELVSEDFGDVGPASDLYSLGFSALEMMVGPEFESLFPDLIAFGRDRQMAWMMWHCSADRKLPPVNTLLAGVPDDLAGVIQKLTCKSQSERYQNADEVIADLSGHTAPVGKSLKDDAAKAEAIERERRKKRRRRLAAVSFCSLLLTIAIIYFTRPAPEAVERTAPPSVYGVVQNVLPIDQKLVLKIGTDWKEFSLRSDDSVMLNRKQRQLRDLDKDDRVVVHYRLEPEGKTRYEIVAFRPESHVGVVAEVQAEESKFLLKVTEGEDTDKEFLLLTPEDTPITLNALKEVDGAAVTVSELQEGDRVVVNHSDDESGMLALSIEALRETSLSGFARKIDLRNRTITVALNELEKDTTQFVRIPLDANCVVTLNGLASLNEQLLKVADVLPGDKVTLYHDLTVKSIEASRVFYDAGTISGVSDNSIIIDSSSYSRRAAYKLPSEVNILLGSEQVRLADLRVGDTVELSHISPGDPSPPLESIAVTRPVDRNKWAILIANDSFDDTQINPISTPIESANQLQQMLNKRYAVPEAQTFYCENLERVRLMQEIPKWIDQVPAGAELYVYLSTRAFGTVNENVYFAVKDSLREEIDDSGIAFDWLLDQLDNCKTTQKVLLLDCTHQDSDSDPNQVTAPEMIEIVRSTHRGGYPRSVYVLGSCREAQVGGPSDGNVERSLFAETLAQGFAGAADQVGDNRLEITELADYVEKAMAEQSSISGVAQNPVLILPDASPPRISAQAKKAIIDLLGRFSQKKFDLELLAEEVTRAKGLALNQPEPGLAYGILLMRANKMDQALVVLDEVRLNHPSSIPAHRSLIWLQFYKTRYDDGLSRLIAMFDQIPKPDELDEGYSEHTLQIFEWAGRLRELAGNADWTARVPSQSDLDNYDAMLAQFGDEPAKRHQVGRQHVASVLKKFDADIAANEDSPSRLKKRRIRSYLDPVADDQLIQIIKSGLDK